MLTCCAYAETIRVRSHILRASPAAEVSAGGSQLTCTPPSTLSAMRSCRASSFARSSKESKFLIHFRSCVCGRGEAAQCGRMGELAGQMSTGSIPGWLRHVGLMRRADGRASASRTTRTLNSAEYKVRLRRFRLPSCMLALAETCPTDCSVWTSACMLPLAASPNACPRGGDSILVFCASFETPPRTSTHKSDGDLEKDSAL